ncbi:APC family permease [Hydrogenimonas thermophila]|uniref:Amino acid transporter n=1 Tax=Hydrogenimonas thermophila TaxID=223786 RepID=A0A1I5QI46_9BACT|nr:APC family permease [Hydrogenimonas thermophila]SFP45741.1 Amino acid transporter [Hydrogenimonas thermophila]
MCKSLGLKELIAIAIGGMVGGGIFTILGISVSMIGSLAPFAIVLGGLIAFFAAYAYVKLGVYYKDEGATYAFFQRTYPNSHLAASFIGWYTIFGYISTLALYAYTFSSYTISGTEFAHNELMRKCFAIIIIWIFAFINLWSVKGMGKLEDAMVYAKLAILFVISMMLIYADNNMDLKTFYKTVGNDLERINHIDILIVASITFVAYEGFQLVINGVKEMDSPEKNIPRAIYISLLLVATIYFIISLSSIIAIPVDDLIQNKEYALAFGAEKVMGAFGRDLVIIGAILATSSAISSTMFGSSRQMARIADDRYLPNILCKRKGTIPTYAILAMAITASVLILVGGLRLILEFGSITFLFVSLLMAIANFKIRHLTNSSTLMGITTIIGLVIGAVLIVWYEYQTRPEQMIFILAIYIILSLCAWGYAYVASKSKLF